MLHAYCWVCSVYRTVATTGFAHLNLLRFSRRVQCGWGSRKRQFLPCWRNPFVWSCLCCFVQDSPSQSDLSHFLSTGSLRRISPDSTHRPEFWNEKKRRRLTFTESQARSSGHPCSSGWRGGGPVCDFNNDNKGKDGYDGRVIHSSFQPSILKMEQAWICLARILPSENEPLHSCMCQAFMSGRQVWGCKQLQLPHLKNSSACHNCAGVSFADKENGFSWQWIWFSSPFLTPRWNMQTNVRSILSVEDGVQALNCSLLKLPVRPKKSTCVTPVFMQKIFYRRWINLKWSYFTNGKSLKLFGALHQICVMPHRTSYRALSRSAASNLQSYLPNACFRCLKAPRSTEMYRDLLVVFLSVLVKCLQKPLFGVSFFPHLISIDKKIPCSVVSFLLVSATSTLSLRKGQAPQPSITFSFQARGGGGSQ